MGKNSNPVVVSFHEVDKAMLASVGGKGANLGELSRIEGIHVPDGFCITTEAFNMMIQATPLVSELLDKLSRLRGEDRDGISKISREIRRAIEGAIIPDNIREEIIRFILQLGENDAYAVRSSATVEDLPTASFAGQQDTHLNIIGKEAILKHISKCWASLFTERAVNYRIQNLQSGFDYRKVQMSVVVQKMVFPQAAGVLFTAEPVSGHRRITSINASFGLGEAIVSGLVNADSYKIHEGKIIEKMISPKKSAIYALKDGGTEEQEIDPERQNTQTLTDAQILELERIGRRIEAHFGNPQDIEWCLVDDAGMPGGYAFDIVQTRPITTLFPVPQADDQENHVYISVGHQQMMTDAMKPLGLSFWLLMTPPKTRSAGGRLFVDVTPMLASPDSRNTIINTLGKFDPLIKDALTTIIERGDFIRLLAGDEKASGPGQSSKAGSLPDYEALNEYDPTIVSDLITRSETSLEALKQNIQKKSGLELFDFILADVEQLKKDTTDPRNLGVIMTGMNASSWVNEKMDEWLGEKNAADIISQFAPNNITSEMGLELLDVADVIRSYPQVVDFLSHIQIGIKSDDFLAELVSFDSGQKAYEAITAYLNKYGMRCAGEIDITKTRWIEKPATLVPLILSNIKNFKHGEAKRRFEQGRQQALEKEKELLHRLKQLPDGEQKARETKGMIDLVRYYGGYREYPKYAIINRYFVYKQAIMKEAARLVKTHVVHKKEDVYYLSFEELKELVQTKRLNYEVIDKRKEEYKIYKKLSPPRVITSDGEIVTGRYKRENLPAGAIAGLAVSSGVVEGRARVILSMEDADMEDGDILVTSFTDPSWTPLFVSIKGLITEVGGLMTHGAVIAREYGLPAVVGVENATRLIKDGQRIRLNGTDGYVEIL